MFLLHEHFWTSKKKFCFPQDADKSLTPQLKRFSMSPRENRFLILVKPYLYPCFIISYFLSFIWYGWSHRNVEELTRRAAQEKVRFSNRSLIIIITTFLCLIYFVTQLIFQFSVQESRIDNYTTKELVNDSPRIKSHHQIINMANLEIPITENNDNVEKAEAYTKELENVETVLSISIMKHSHNTNISKLFKLHLLFSITDLQHSEEETRGNERVTCPCCSKQQ